MTELTIGVDVGGTKIAAGVVDEQGAILYRVRRETRPDDADAIISTIIDVVRDLAGEHTVSSVGIGSAGFVDAQRSTVMFAPNLAWRDMPVRDLVAAATGLPAVVENDANAAAWGEFRFGAASDLDYMVCVTIGTGVGGGIVIGGELFRGAHGIGAEIGHFQFVPGGHLCGCGLRGCFEQYASGRALVREAAILAKERPAEAAGLVELAGGDPAAIAGPMVTQAARDGDPAAIELLARIGRWLGEGLASLSALLDPEVFVIGGGASDAGDLLVGPAAAEMSDKLTGKGHRPEPEVRLATLGNDAGLVGVADLARI